ncbi:MAG TPA: IclR family transcriptional regulator [Pusillimonas sp.]|nr:IclR family transcriptional regulator [Pusillimonas sp.]|tara:strand:+ start:35676 stop:36473 length:798 start_codon:yes stop_codon:yes gene_type:complete
MPSYNSVTALLRGIEVLRVINQLEEASVGAIHGVTGINKPTVVRMLETLIAEGYVAKDAGGWYVTTGKTLLLSQGYDLHRRVAALAEPLLTEAQSRLGWPLDIGLRDQDAMLVVQGSRHRAPMFFARKPGFRAPILQTSLGRAYLAYCDETEKNDILQRLSETENSGYALSMSRKDIDALLTEVRLKEYAVMDDVYSQRECGGNFWAMAVPVLNAGKVLGAVNLMVVRHAVDPSTAANKYLEELKSISAALRPILMESRVRADVN